MRLGFSLLPRTAQVTRAHWPILRDLAREVHGGAEIPVAGATVAACRERARAMADHAGAALTLAVEPLNRFECAARDTTAQAGRPAADAGGGTEGDRDDTFDAGIEERDPAGAIGATAGVVSDVHVSGNSRGNPGRGHIDVAASKAAGHDGWLTDRAFGQALPDLAAATRLWRPLSGSEAELHTGARALVRRHWNRERERR